jgi:hypothetical protein
MTHCTQSANESAGNEAAFRGRLCCVSLCCSLGGSGHVRHNAHALATLIRFCGRVNDLPQDVKMAQMLVESKEFAALDGDSRSGEGTEIQRAIRGYVGEPQSVCAQRPSEAWGSGTFLEHMDMLPMDSAQSMSKLNTLLQSYLSAPEDLPATLKKIRDKVNMPITLFVCDLSHRCLRTNSPRSSCYQEASTQRS